MLRREEAERGSERGEPNRHSSDEERAEGQHGGRRCNAALRVYTAYRDTRGKGEKSSSSAGSCSISMYLVTFDIAGSKHRPQNFPTLHVLCRNDLIPCNIVLDHLTLTDLAETECDFFQNPCTVEERIFHLNQLFSVLWLF